MYYEMTDYVRFLLNNLFWRNT